MSDIAKTPTTAVAEASYAPAPSATTRPRRRWLRVGGVTFALILAGLLIAYPAGVLDRVFAAPTRQGDVFVVEPTTLNVTLQEEGELRPVNSVDVKCEIQGQSVTIQWIVDESTRVRKGDLLVKLASDDMEDRLSTEEIQLDSARSALEEAESALEITKRDNASQLKKAEIDLEVARLELKRYLEGDYKNAKKSIEINIAQTEMDIVRKEDELRKSEVLQKKQFVSEVEIEEIKAALKKARMTLEKYQLEFEILDKYELPKNRMQKTAAVERAQEELEQERARAASRLRQAETKVETCRNQLKTREEKFERLQEQLANCEIHAPIDGVVQYGGANSGRRRWNSHRIAVGERVYSGQTLITLPDTSEMLVSTRIHEADRHKVSEGLPCIVRVPAVPGQAFKGTLSKIAKFADSEGSWWNPDLKEHATEVLLDQTDAPMSPGDTAVVEILIEEVPDVLAVPIQCVFARGSQHFVFVREAGAVKPVEVDLGRSSTTSVEVAAGLAAGDRVVMAPDDEALAQLPTPGATPGGLAEAPEEG